MAGISYADLYPLSSAASEEHEVAVGDLVRTGPNCFPNFRVIALHGDKAWLEGVDNRMDAIVDRARCRKVADQSSPVATGE